MLLATIWVKGSVLFMEELVGQTVKLSFNQPSGMVMMIAHVIRVDHDFMVVSSRQEIYYIFFTALRTIQVWSDAHEG